MKKLSKIMFVFFAFVLSFNLVACNTNNNGCDVAEKVTLASTMLGEVEFETDEQTKISQDCSSVTISGSIQNMSTAQKSEFGDENATHVVVLKFEFDKEKTVESFEIKGEKTKVYSSDETAENYVGSLSDLLDNGPSEDAYCYLILSANTKSYTLKTTYTDKTSSTISVSISATLVSANEE